MTHVAICIPSTGTHVAICIPSTGTHETSMSMALANLIANGAGLTISLLAIDHAAPAQARNTLVDKALEANADYLFWIDSDIVLKPHTLKKLLEHMEEHILDIVGVPYPMREPPFALQGKPLDPAAQKGLREFEFMAGGCMLVRSQTYLDIPRPWYFESYGYDGIPLAQFAAALKDAVHEEIPSDVQDVIAGLLWGSKNNAFQDWLSALKTPLTVDRSEDTNFCRKARRHGYRIWGDLDLAEEIAHMARIGIQLKAMRERTRTEP